MLSRQGRMARTRRSRGTPGQALVEFALVLPIFLLILAAVFEFSFYAFQQMTMANAAREGARFAAQMTQQAGSLVLAQSKAQSTGASNGFLEDDNFTMCWVRSSPSRIADGSLDASTCRAMTWQAATEEGSDPEGPRRGDSIVVNAESEYRPLTPLVMVLPREITASAQMVFE